MDSNIGRVAALWRGARGDDPAQTRNYERLGPVFDALSDQGVMVEATLWSDQASDAVHDALLGFDGVLVWVDPIAGADDRTVLDAVLRDVSKRGGWVSAHPDTIAKMGTKEVLYRTKHLGWGADTDLYTSMADFRQRFPSRLRAGQARVLKQNRGNGGIGVWKVALAETTIAGSATPTLNTIVTIQHAAPRDSVTEDVALGEFMDRCTDYFASAGKVIDQPFVGRLRDGMIRAYLVVDQVVGFARQGPAATAPAASLLGMPSAKTMSNADDPTLDTLRTDLEREWVPELCRTVGLERDELPLLWDADFLYGPPTEARPHNFILCEINVSSVLPFPPQAPAALALAVRQRLR